MGFIKNIINRADAFYRLPQLEAFYEWAGRHAVSKDSLMYVHLESENLYVRCRDTTLVKPSSKEHVQFIVCDVHNVREAMNNFPNENTWFQIFHSPDLEIWENKKFHTDSLPLRFGFSEGEMQILYNIAYQAINRGLTGVVQNTYDVSILERISRFKEGATVDVVLWVNNELRGSIVVSRANIVEAVHDAAVNAMKDVRFKPIQKRELESIIFEINFASDLKIPISILERSMRSPDGQKGYVAQYQNKVGWYFPTIFNRKKYYSMYEVIETLLEQKAHLSKDEAGYATIFTFAVNGFIGKKNEVNVLIGPVASSINTARKFNVLKNTHSELITIANLSAEFLLRMQDDDGYIPLFFDPLLMKIGGMDWPRMALTCHALLEYGLLVQDSHLVEAAEKGVLFLENSLAATPNLGLRTRLLTLAYLGQIYMLKHDSTRLREILHIIRNEFEQIEYGSIIYSMLASFFAQHDTVGELEFAGKIANAVYDNFKRRTTTSTSRENIELAEYPELLHTYSLLYQKTGDALCAQKYSEVREWLLTKQNPDGSFFARIHTPMPYSRGTGKIFEVLAFDRQQNIEVLEKTYTWLLLMQYSEKNIYFVHDQYHNACIGGLRSSYTNTEAWIDGVAHFLLGIVRLIK